MTFDGLSRQTKKYRVAHDLSFPIKKGTSINACTIEDDLPSLYYGQALRRTAHNIHKLRQIHQLNGSLSTNGISSLPINASTHGLILPHTLWQWYIIYMHYDVTFAIWFISSSSRIVYLI